VIHFFELLFPFWCLATKGGEESIYLLVVYHFIWSLACKTLIMLSRSCGHGF
jgi:hypothetical protein